MSQEDQEQGQGQGQGQGQPEEQAESNFTSDELLAWHRFLTLTLFGAAMSYVREREGNVDGLIAAMSDRLSGAFAGMSGGGVESAMLGLLLNVEALGAGLRGEATSPEMGQMTLESLPGQRLVSDLQEHFDVGLTEDELLSISGAERAELNRLLDVIGAIAVGNELDFIRLDFGEIQQMIVRVW